MQKDNAGEFPEKRRKRDFDKNPGARSAKSSGITKRESSRKDDSQINESARVSKDEVFRPKAGRRPSDNEKTLRRSASDERPRRTASRSNRPDQQSDRPRRSQAERSKPYSRDESPRRQDSPDERPRRYPSSGDKPDQQSDRPRRSPADRGKPYSREEKPRRQDSPDERPRRYPSSGDKPDQQSDRPRRSQAERGKPYSRDERPGRQNSPDEDPKRPRYSEEYRGNRSEPTGTRKSRAVKADLNGPLRLNKFIANAGICSRREADKLIEAGAVKVNGIIVTELGTKVSLHDKVQLGDQTLSAEKLRYVLLNKPKAYITTVDDPFKRNTVMQLVSDACRERIYPVGRLDRNTTGLLLFTNDGELTRRLTHPRFGVRKIYDVELDRPLSRNDFDSIASGVELDGDVVTIDEIAYVELDKNKKHIGIELHSGQNHVVRRIFEKFGYEVVKLDRVMFGPLTKKNLPRGRWRYLEDNEVRMLKRL